MAVSGNLSSPGAGGGILGEGVTLAEIGGGGAGERDGGGKGVAPDAGTKVGGGGPKPPDGMK